MTAIVKAKVDLFDASNALEVPVGSEGVVTQYTIPPHAQTWLVNFTVDQSTVTRWVTDNDIIFKDGPLGPFKAVAELSPQAVTKVEYPKVIHDTDVIIGRQLSAVRSEIRITFSEGLVVDMKADLNTGEINFTFVDS